jgi:hypothetical protein
MHILSPEDGLTLKYIADNGNKIVKRKTIETELR